MKKTIRMTVPEIRSRKKGPKIVMLTAYDRLMASLLDQAGIDILLAGDSYAMTELGYDTTLPVTMEEMLTITAAVARGAEHALIVADMPFLSYQIDLPSAKRNAGRFLKEAGAHAVKIENSGHIPEIIQAVVEIDIPVMGHIGLTPQSVHHLGGYGRQGNTEQEAERLLVKARSLEKAGIFSLVLENIPADLGRLITQEISIPTIGIGAGPDCDGQVQVIHDLLGMDPLFQPPHSRPYAKLHEIISQSAEKYIRDVRENHFTPISAKTKKQANNENHPQPQNPSKGTVNIL